MNGLKYDKDGNKMAITFKLLAKTEVKIIKMAGNNLDWKQKNSNQKLLKFPPPRSIHKISINGERRGPHGME